MGLLSGLFGVGGGILVVPALVIVYNFDQHLAQATSLAVMILTAAAGVARYHMQGHLVEPRFAALLALGSIIGAYFLGAPLANRMPAKDLERYFGLFVFLISLRMMGVYAWVGSLFSRH